MVASAVGLSQGLYGPEVHIKAEKSHGKDPEIEKRDLNIHPSKHLIVAIGLLANQGSIVKRADLESVNGTQKWSEVANTETENGQQLRYIGKNCSLFLPRLMNLVYEFGLG